MRVELEVNGDELVADVPPGTSLLALLRTRAGLTGTKESCGRGECGACTVLVGDVPVMSCVLLAVQTRGPVTTVEGLVGRADDLREAFAERFGFQCGYCTPGQIVRAEGLLRAAPPRGLSRRAIRDGMNSNICRCTGYGQIVDAVEETARERGLLAGSGGAEGDTRP